MCQYSQQDDWIEHLENMFNETLHFLFCGTGTGTGTGSVAAGTGSVVAGTGSVVL